MPTNGSVLADDFVVDETREIESTFATGESWNGFTSVLARSGDLAKVLTLRSPPIGY